MTPEAVVQQLTEAGLTDVETLFNDVTKLLTIRATTPDGTLLSVTGDPDVYEAPLFVARLLFLALGLSPD